MVVNGDRFFKPFCYCSSKILSILIVCSVSQTKTVNIIFVCQNIEKLIPSCLNFQRQYNNNYWTWHTIFKTKTDPFIVKFQKLLEHVWLKSFENLYNNNNLMRLHKVKGVC